MLSQTGPLLLSRETVCVPPSDREGVPELTQFSELVLETGAEAVERFEVDVR